MTETNLKCDSTTTIKKQYEQCCPWVEKYRPKNFDDIVLDPLNRKILTNILETNRFPHLLLYGPPGTGKTTTIINLINAYEKKYKQQNQGLMIHLNASDERGIDVIRNQITQFVNSCALFENGTKFVILDEVDYMTKTAQQALKHLLNSVNKNVRFCLICNYITKIDETLQNEFVKLRFNLLPHNETVFFLKSICDSEKLTFKKDTLETIQIKHDSDIRSMINYMQANQDILDDVHVLHNGVWDDLTQFILESKDNSEAILHKLTNIQNTYGLEPRNLLRFYFNYIIQQRKDLITCDFLTYAQNIMHNSNAESDHLLLFIKETLLGFILNPKR